MHLTQRIERHLHGEHARCRDALQDADIAVAAMLDPPKPKKGPTPVVTRTQRKFAEDWAPFSKAVATHVADEARILPELGLIARGSRERPENLDHVLEQLMLAHVELRKQAAQMRGHTMFLDPADPARRAVIAALDAFEDATRAQDAQIYTASRAGVSRVATHEGQSSDVFRAVRAAPRREPTDPEPPSFFARISSLFKR